jgi:hypothetical protein
MESNLAQQLDRVEDLIPKTVDEAVDRLISELPPQDRDLIADVYEDEVPFLSATILGVYIQNEFGLGLGNEALMHSCCSTVGVYKLNFFDASTVIIEKLWKKLRQKYTSQIVN